MPVDISRIDDIAALVAAIYREGETALLRTITDRLATGLDRSDWQTSRLAAISALRRAAAAIVAELQRTGDAEVRAAVAAAYRSGRADAVAELAAWLASGVPAPAPTRGPAARRDAHAVQALADAVVRELRPLYAAILPQVDDAYRRAVAGAAARKLTGATSTREAAQAAWARLTARGITGFVDSAGRRWRLHTYVEMATRAAVTRAAVHGLTDEFVARGIRLVSVDDQPGECVRCRPWEARILALWGPTGHLHLPADRDAASAVDVDVPATLEQAMAAGLFHPGCRHTIRAFRPGVSLLIRLGRTADPVGEAARARQRELERGIRHWRELQAAALTDAGQATARARIAALEAEIARHVARYGLVRKRFREQIGAGHIPPPGRVDDLAAELGIPLPT